MISRLFLYLNKKYPATQMFAFRSLYNFFARKIRNPEWRFMNYGYSYGPGEQISHRLYTEDEHDRQCWQLYEHMIRQFPPDKHSHVLEIGSGRGGGCWFIHKYYKPAMVTGIDFSEKAIDFSRKHYKGEGLRYFTGTADSVPVPDASCELALNVESSHAYPDFPKFMSEVFRVLKPGGMFMITDFRRESQIPDWTHQLEHSGLKLISSTDITSHVLRSIDEQELRKTQLIRKNVPFYFRKSFRQFSGLKGTVIHTEFKSGKRKYCSFILQKQENP